MIPVAVVGLLAMAGATEAQAAGAKLIGNKYDSISVLRNGKPHELVEGTRIRVAFERRRNRRRNYRVVRWGAGCNKFGARVKIRPRRLRTGRILGTRMRCSDALHRQDRWLARFFRRDPRWVRRGARLRLRSGDDVIRLRRRSPGPVDTTPPEFAGLVFAFTCHGLYVPETAHFRLSWEPAADDQTPPSLIVYDVYLASEPGAEDFSHPTWTTPPGATSFITPDLPYRDYYPDQGYLFVVRARDQAGNQDRNTVERPGTQICF